LKFPIDPNYEKIRFIFDLMDEEFLENYEKSELFIGRVNLERKCLNGLNNRRSEIEILAFILKTARGGVKKTKLLYEVNLSGLQLKKYMGFLTGSGFIRQKKISKKSTMYTTTQKGILLLYHWIKIVTLLERPKLELKS
jgi:predicted transcriptional regulator